MNPTLSDLPTLRRQIIALASLPETESPVISAYFDLTGPADSQRLLFNIWAATARQTFGGEAREDFEAARRTVMHALRPDVDPDTRSLAVFARAGEYPLTLAIPLGATMETSFHVGTLPAIFPLVQTKDRFERFVVAICTEESARILEVTVGAVSTELLASTPTIRERIGREWTREHYHHQKRERDRRFVKEKVAVIDRLMSRRGHSHLILAGHPRHVARLRAALPKRLAAQVVGEVEQAPNGNDIRAVIVGALEAFVAAEKRESFSNVERLHEEVRRGGLAVLGIHGSLPVLAEGIAEMLIVSENLPDEDREALVRLATTRDIPIEVCEDDPLLDESGGVGCLLRYRPEFSETRQDGLRLPA